MNKHEQNQQIGKTKYIIGITDASCIVPTIIPSVSSPTYVPDFYQIKPPLSDVRGPVHDSMLHELDLSGSSSDNIDDDYYKEW